MKANTIFPGNIILNLTKFTVYSFIAIAIYNSIFISAGYLLGNVYLNIWVRRDKMLYYNRGS